MAKVFDWFGQKVAGRSLSFWGTGSYVQRMPGIETVRFNDFHRGYVAAVENALTPVEASPGSKNVSTDRKNRLVREPGTTLAYDFGVGLVVPRQAILHPSISGRSELLVPFGADVKLFSTNIAAPVTIAGVLTALADQTIRYTWAVLGDDLIFGNMHGPVKRHVFGTVTVEDMVGIPQGASFCVFAGRLIVGGAEVEGQYTAMAVVWPDDLDIYNFEGINSGAEILLSNDTELGDRIVAMRPMSFDYLAIICRKSVWIGRRTNDALRPIDFSQRVSGKGCLTEPTARLTNEGVMYLSDEGVELFNGNESVHVSEEIDPELATMNSVQLQACTATYNPISQKYILMTSVGTYIYDCLRKRWIRRTMGPIWGTLFANQPVKNTWASVAGTFWSDYPATSWEDMSGHESDVPSMYFLAPTGTGTYGLFVESASSYTMLNNTVQYLYDTPIRNPEKNNFLATHKECRVGYESTASATIQLYLPNAAGQMESVRTITLPSTAGVEKFVISPGEHSGLGVGMQIEFVTGDPKITALEMDFIRRGRRID